MDKAFKNICTETAGAIMKDAGWEPQTFELSDWKPVVGQISSLMNELAQGNMQKAASTLTATCDEIADYLNERYQINKSQTPEDVEKTIRQHLVSHYTLP